MRKIFLLLLLPLLFGSQCHKDEDCHKTINFVNNGNYSVYVLNDYFSYPDTISFENSAGYIKSYRIEANSENSNVLSLRSCYEAEFNYYKTGILMIYVFNADTVDNNSWGYIVDNYKVKRYDLTLNDLNHMNWTITYP